MTGLFSINNQVAVITGAGSGIGLATAHRFAKASARLILADLKDTDEIAKSVGGIFVKTDVSDEDQVQALMHTAVEEYGQLDIVVNNAGVFADYKRLEETEAKDFDFCFDVNAKGIAWGIKFAAPLISEYGRIINTASAAAIRGAVSLSSYSASKHAVVGITRTAALELAEKKIRVNCICPTTVDTPMAHEDGGDYLVEAETTLIPLQRICRPEEVAALIHFLAARDCDFINGQAIVLDGGLSAGITEAAFEKLSLK